MVAAAMPIGASGICPAGRWSSCPVPRAWTERTLRGLQLAALFTGDLSWNEKPEQIRRLIIERRFEMPDGCTPESFPRSARNEGCSIADWFHVSCL